MTKLILLIGMVLLFVGCGEHTTNFTEMDKLILTKDCITTNYSDNYSEGILKKGSEVIFIDYCKAADNTIHVANETDVWFKLSEYCVEKAEDLSSKSLEVVYVPKEENVTMFKLKVVCEDVDGKTTDELLDKVEFTSDKFVSCIVNQARIKYEPVVSIVGGNNE